MAGIRSLAPIVIADRCARQFRWGYAGNQILSGSGKHTITASTPTSPPDGGGLRHLHAAFIIVFFVYFIFFLLITNKPVSAPSQSLTAAQQPTPPAPRFAEFESRSSSLMLVIGGGNYEFIYRSVADGPSLLHALSGKKFFTADFVSGKTSGDFRDFDVLVLFGSVKLSVGAIGEIESLRVDVLSRGKDINAYFNYSTSPRGPPLARIARLRKTIYIVGELKEVNIQSGYGRSSRDIKLLDLDPSPVEEQRYISAKHNYDRRVEQQRIQQESREAIRRDVGPPRPKPRPHHR